MHIIIFNLIYKYIYIYVSFIIFIFFLVLVYNIILISLTISFYNNNKCLDTFTSTPTQTSTPTPTSTSTSISTSLPEHCNKYRSPWLVVIYILMCAIILGFAAFGHGISGAVSDYNDITEGGVFRWYLIFSLITFIFNIVSIGTIIAHNEKIEDEEKKNTNKGYIAGFVITPIVFIFIIYFLIKQYNEIRIESPSEDILEEQCDASVDPNC
jgi:hypothetical protein